MARLIINEGDGPRTVELQGVLSVGSNPGCDIVLGHHTAIGVRAELKPLRFGYRVSIAKGELLVNGRATEMADLEHNDTLKVGEVLILYKQPEGEAFDPSGGARAAGAGPGGPVELLRDEVAADELSDADVLALAGLAPLDEPLEELDELELLEDDALEELEVLGELEELGPERHAHETQGLDDALLRAKHKRLEALRRLKSAKRGGSAEGPALSAPGALEAVAALDDEGVAELEGLEWSQGLTEASVPEILERARQVVAEREAERLAAERAAAAEAERLAAERAAAAEAERLAAEQAAGAEAERVAAEQAAAAEAERAAAELELEELEELDELELEPVPASAPGLGLGGAPSIRAPAPRVDPQVFASPNPPRPLPPGGVRFRRPLPPGHRAPAFLPPVHPGSPPA